MKVKPRLALALFLASAIRPAFLHAGWAYRGNFATRQARLNLGRSYLVATDLRRAFLKRGPGRSPAGPILKAIWSMPTGDALRQKKMDVILYVLQQDFGITARNLAFNLFRSPLLLELAEERAKAYLAESAAELCQEAQNPGALENDEVEEAMLGLGRLSKFYLDFIEAEQGQDMEQSYRLLLRTHALSLTHRSQALSGALQRIMGNIDSALQDEITSVPAAVMAQSRAAVSPNLARAAARGFKKLSARAPLMAADQELFAQAFVERHYRGMKLAASRGQTAPAVILPSFLKGIRLEPEVELAARRGRLKLHFIESKEDGFRIVREHLERWGESLAVLPVMWNRGEGLKPRSGFKPAQPWLMVEDLMAAFSGGEASRADFIKTLAPASLRGAAEWPARLRLPRPSLPGRKTWQGLFQEMKSAKFIAGLILTYLLHSYWADAMVRPYLRFAGEYFSPYHEALRHESPVPDIFSSAHISLIFIATLAGGLAMGAWMARRTRSPEAKTAPRLMSVYWATALGLLLGLWIGGWLCRGFAL
ncbi:MAG: hypothetical protein HY921_08690 [Elusimicrobia bacterium]|nr:hypothetical protein [Elusimicrobiota bacterium]